MPSAVPRWYLRLLRELEGVDAVGEVGGERVVQLAQRLLQRLQRLLVLLQRVQLLLQTNLPVDRLQGGQDHRIAPSPGATDVTSRTH